MSFLNTPSARPGYPILNTLAAAYILSRHRLVRRFTVQTPFSRTNNVLCFFLNTPAAVGWLVGQSLHCPYTILQKLYFVFFFINTLAAAGSSISHRLDGVFTVHTPSSRNYVLCLLNTPSAGPGYLRALLYSMSIIQRNHPSVFLQD